ncbi:hypothetical protein [Erwinia phage FBB1]|nr:hypothetical protein [Erwinia phage FBB1]
MVHKEKTISKYRTGKVMLFGICLAVGAVLLIPEPIPKEEYKKEIEMMATTYVLINQVCPNKIGVLSLRDSYTNTIEVISKRTWVQGHFESIFTSKCNNVMQQMAATSTISAK